MFSKEIITTDCLFSNGFSINVWLPLWTITKQSETNTNDIMLTNFQRNTSKKPLIWWKYFILQNIQLCKWKYAASLKQVKFTKYSKIHLFPIENSTTTKPRNCNLLILEIILLTWFLKKWFDFGPCSVPTFPPKSIDIGEGNDIGLVSLTSLSKLLYIPPNKIL